MDFAKETLFEEYNVALETSVTCVAIRRMIYAGFSRSLDDFDEYIYVCDLLEKPSCRGKEIGRKLIECIYRDYPNQVVYVMSDEDEYSDKVNYKRIGSRLRFVEYGFWGSVKRA